MECVIISHLWLEKVLKASLYVNKSEGEIMSLLELVKKFADENPEYGITAEEEWPGVTTDTIMKVSKPRIEIILRPRIGFITTCANKDKSFMKRIKGLMKDAAEEGIELHVEPTETRMSVSKMKTFDEAIKGAEKILKFLKKHDLDWIP